MFTGIVEQVGRVAHTAPQGGNLRVTIEPARMWSDLTLGESVACSGTCLTVTGWDERAFTVDLSRETLAKTAPHWQADRELKGCARRAAPRPARGRRRRTRRRPRRCG